MTALQALASRDTDMDMDIITDIRISTDTTKNTWRLITGLTDMMDTDIMVTTVLPPMPEATTRELTTTTGHTMIIFTDVDTDIADIKPSTRKLVRIQFCLFSRVLLKKN